MQQIVSPKGPKLWIRLNWILLCAVILSACGTTQIRDTSPKTLTDTYQLDRWEAKGKLSLKVEGKAQSASFSWSQKRENFDIHVYGPLGQGSAYIIKRGDRYTLKTKEGKTYAQSAEELLSKTNGLDIPVSNLIYWMRGLAAPDSAIGVSSLYPDTTYERLGQDNWQIHYRSYTQIDGYTLPQKLKATRENIKLIMNIKSWHLN